jgi:hypothetical protein
MKLRKRDWLIIDCDTEETIQVAIPDFAWGEIMYSLFDATKVIDRNPTMFTKKGLFRIRAIDRETKSGVRVWLYTYVNYRGVTKRVYIEKRSERIESR